MVDHQRDEAEFARPNSAGTQPILELCAKEQGLPAIHVGYPAIDHQNAEEFLRIRNLRKDNVRKNIVGGEAVGTPRVARAEVATGFDSSAVVAELNVNFRVGMEELGGDTHDRSC